MNEDDADFSVMPSQRGPFSENIKHAPVTARVPEKINRGVASTATMILQTDDVFVLDFLSTMLKPHQIVARVVVTVPTFTKMVYALQQNVKKYEQRFGKLTARSICSAPATDLPPVRLEKNTPASGKETLAAGEQASCAETPSSEMSCATHNRIADLYDELTLPDDLLGGAFANTAMVSHTAEEFSFDFVTSFYPRSVVTSRVFLAAGRIPSLLRTMCSSLQKYQAGNGDGGTANEPRASS